MTKRVRITVEITDGNYEIDLEDMDKFLYTTLHDTVSLLVCGWKHGRPRDEANNIATTVRTQYKW